MSWDWGNIPAGLSAAVALGSALWSAFSALRSRKARAEADQRARDAAEAAVRSADAESRAAAAIERLTAVHEEDARLRSRERTSRPSWYLQRRDKFNVLLHNVSSESLFHVTANGGQIGTPGGYTWRQIDRGSPEEIHVMPGDDNSEEITVTWYDTEIETGQPHRWRGRPM